jgi:pimeloyl-ACP methyl ester carboxylesterase
MVTIDVSEEMMRRRPDSRLFEITDAGHDVLLDRPDG